MESVRIGITAGDPAGVGPEVINKALKKLVVPADCQVFVFGNKRNLILPQKTNLISVVSGVKKLPKGPSKESGSASLLYLKSAVSYLKNNVINSLVTGPVSKEAISSAGYKFIGHTEFLASEFSIKNFAMMFLSDKLKVSLVTRHIPFKNIVSGLNTQSIYKTIMLTYECLQHYYKIDQPRVAVAGINPHASEGGKIGNEEARVIKPAVEKARRKIKYIFGPLPADSIFNRACEKEFDAVVSMYHDQGMIAFKLVAFGSGVNLTLGLPFIRTSPVHGTAFDLAGKNRADCGSMLEAIRLAYKLTKNRINLAQ